MASVLAKVRGSVLRRKRKRRYATTEEGQGRKGSASVVEDGPEEGRVAAFVEWCQSVGISLHPKLYIGRHGSCAAVGVVALEDIAEGECLALIPRAALLNCTNSCVHPVVGRDQQLQAHLLGVNSWVPLLISLLAEYSQKSSSHWYPYLSLVPNNEHAGPPMLWSTSERDRLLQGTGVEERVRRDIHGIEEDFETVVLPFMQRHPQVFRKTLHSQQLFQKLVSFVMSYSFTDAEEEDILQQTMMVPFVDLLNHHSHHHAELNFHEDCLELVAVRSIGKGEEVMNTYGPLPNTSLLHTYGFTEPGNPHDVACISSEAVREVFVSGGTAPQSRKEKRWKQLQNDDVVEGEYEVGCSGEPDKSLLATVKLLHVRLDGYHLLKEQLLHSGSSDEKSEEEEEEEEQEICLTSLKQKEMDFLERLVEHCLGKFPEDCDANLRTAASGNSLTERERHALHLSIGQQKCLMALKKRLGNTGG